MVDEVAAGADGEADGADEAMAQVDSSSSCLLLSFGADCGHSANSLAVSLTPSLAKRLYLVRRHYQELHLASSRPATLLDLPAKNGVNLAFALAAAVRCA